MLRYAGHHVDADGNSCKYSAGPCTPKCNLYCVGYGAKHGGHCESNKCCCVRAASDLQSSTPNWSHVDFFAHSV